jgi:DNA-binding response OmpR family regulator
MPAVDSVAVLPEEWTQHRRRLELETRVLVVDDDASSRKELDDLLRGLGISGRSVGNPELAVELLDSGTYSLALVSDGFSGLGGLYFIRQMRAQYPDVDSIITTIDPAVELFGKVFDLHALDVLVRPFATTALVGEQLRAALRRGVERRLRTWMLGELRQRLQRLQADTRLRAMHALEHRLSLFKLGLGAFDRVLVVEDNDLRALSELLLLAGLHVETALELDEAMARASAGSTHLLAVAAEPDPVSLDQLLGALREQSPLVELMLVAKHPTVEHALTALRRGVAVYQPWPAPSTPVVVQRVGEALRRSRRERLMDNLLGELFHVTHRDAAAAAATFESFRSLVGLQRRIAAPETPGERADAVEAVDFLDEVLDNLLSPEEELVITHEIPSSELEPLADSEGAERRQHYRVPESQFVRFRPKAGPASTLALLGDLSEGGLFIRTGELLLPGTLLEVDLNVELAEQGFLIRCRGQVAWVARDNHQSPMGPGFGIKFLDPPPDVADLLHRIVLARLKEQPAQ